MASNAGNVNPASL